MLLWRARSMVWVWEALSMMEKSFDNILLSSTACRLSRSTSRTDWDSLLNMFEVSSNPQAFCPSTGEGEKKRNSTGHHRFIIHVKQIMPYTLDQNPFRKEQIPDLNVESCTVSDPVCFLSPIELLSFQHCKSSGNPGSPFISWWWACAWHQSTKPLYITVLVLHLKSEVYKDRMVHFGGNHYYIIL